MNRGAEQTLGVLSIEATLDDVYRRLFDTAIVILISQGAKTFVVSFFILYIVNRLITRHLVTAAKFLGGYDLRRSPPPLRLERRPLQQVDELDQLVGAEEKQAIEAALTESRGRLFGPSGAAAKLGIARSTLDSKIKTLKIDKNRFKVSNPS